VSTRGGVLLSDAAATDAFASLCAARSPSRLPASLPNPFKQAAATAAAAAAVSPVPQVPPSHAVIILGHNGPAGLGSQRHAICGCDWLAEAGDHGDPGPAGRCWPRAAAGGPPPALVVFGHMHHQLQGPSTAAQLLLGPSRPCRNCFVGSTVGSINRHCHRVLQPIANCYVGATTAAAAWLNRVVGC